MSGRRNRSRWWQRLRRWDFTIRSATVLSVVVGLLLGAIIDLVNTAKDKDERVQKAELQGQLAQFLLSTREPDGSTLLENPIEFSDPTRSLQILTLRRSFFTYFLHSGNARTFKVGDIVWEPRRACQVEFAHSPDAGVATSALRACFAAVLGDPSGRYVYFSLQYPTSKIQRHIPGRPLADASRVVLTFAGQKETRLTIGFQPPPLAKARYPSQMARFEGLHELVGYVAEEGGRPTKYASGQAFERILEEDGGAVRNFVTLVGRIDIAALVPTAEDTGLWPSPAVKAIRIGARVHEVNGASKVTRETHNVAVGALGTPLVSLSQAYLSSVPSRARLEVTAKDPGKPKRTIWRSEDAEIAELPRIHSLWQSAADWWTEKWIVPGNTKESALDAESRVQVSGQTDVRATLKAVPATLPDLATRAFTWLSITVIIIVLLSADWAVYIYRLLRLRGTAYTLAVHSGRGGNLVAYSEGKNEIGTLGRVFHLLIAKNRLRDASMVRRNRLDESRKAEFLRLTEAHVLNRKAILDAIGHEIRSPLQTLLSKTRDNPDVQKDLARVRRAVEALHDATSVENGLRNGEIVIVKQDLAEFLRRLSGNLVEAGKPVVYVGPSHEVVASIDSIQLEQILDHLIGNAIRHRWPGTSIELRLKPDDQSVTLAVFNHGPNIPEADLERIFVLGVTDGLAPESSGLGLFASRIYGLAMGLTIRAQNEPTGVSLILTFPSPDTLEQLAHGGALKRPKSNEDSSVSKGKSEA
jgi:signal transduction histidine kinase